MKKIFIHGLGQNNYSWDNVIRNLLTKDNILCPNLNDIVEEEKLSYNNIYSSLKKYLLSFNNKLNLCGLSLGAVLALNFAIEYPDKVSSLILIAPQYKMPKTLLFIQNIIFKLLPNFVFNRSSLSKESILTLTKSMINIDLSNILYRVNSKTLILCGEKDIFNKKASQRLSSLINKSELRIIKNAGHEINTDKPYELALEINKFYKLG